MNKLKKISIYVLAIALVFHVTMVITGNTHVYKVLANTVFKGRLSPSIDEYTIYHNREVAIGQVYGVEDRCGGQFRANQAWRLILPPLWLLAFNAAALLALNFDLPDRRAGRVVPLHTRGRRRAPCVRG